MTAQIQHPEIEESIELVFGQVTAKKWPSLRSISLSVCLHGLAVAGLGLISLTAPVEKPKPPVMGAWPTIIRIAGRLYYVAQVTPPDQTVAPVPVRRKIAGKRSAPARTAPKATEQEAPAPAPVAESRPAPRLFVPPEARKSKVVSDVTLLQPLLPPVFVPVVPPLPSFSISTAQLQAPKIPKPFVAPGRRTPPPPDPTQPLPPPNVDLIHADPVASNVKPMLALPAPPPPFVEPSPKTSAFVEPPTPAGDPVDILSLSDKPAPPADDLVVPPMNAISKTGEGATAGSGGSGSASASTRATTLASAIGGEVTILGGAGTTRPSAGPERAPLGSEIIVHPANGHFDAIVVQSSSLDQFPESKGLLTGKPIYTVYISLGTAKDWALYFCVPGEAVPAAANPSAISLGSSTPVQAPYPTRLVRPGVAVPAYYKYILVHGFVTTAGRFENLSVVRPTRPEMDQAVVASLSGWEFRAATRDGVKIAVEFLLSIPVSGM